MNREIKFRAFNTIDNEWYGDDLAKRLLYRDTIGEKYDREKWKIVQFTGLKDKNGKEVYEGDICKDDDGRIYSVIGQPGYFSFAGGVMGCGDLEQSQMQIEVIGNIYENPELINSVQSPDECDATKVK